MSKGSDSGFYVSWKGGGGGGESEEGFTIQ